MTLAEFNAVVRKDVAWKVLFKVAVAIIGGCATLFSVLIVPVLWIYGLKYGADGVDGVRKDTARLEEHVRGLTHTVGNLQLQVAGVGTELKTMKGEQSRGIDAIQRDIGRLLDARATAPPRPIRQSAQPLPALPRTQ